MVTAAAQGREGGQGQGKEERDRKERAHVCVMCVGVLLNWMLPILAVVERKRERGIKVGT